MQSGHHIISVSLGGPGKPSGLVVVEPRSKYFHPKGDESRLEWDNHYDVRWLERLAAERSYPAIVARIRECASARRLTARDCSLLVDITATGRAPLRLFEDQGLYPEPIEVMSAGDAAYHNDLQQLPARDMIGAVQVAFQSRRIEVSDKLELAATLLTDLQAFDPTATSPAARASRNDDLVTAVAIAVWWGERLQWNEEIADRMLPYDDDDRFDDRTRSVIGGY